MRRAGRRRDASTVDHRNAEDIRRNTHERPRRATLGQARRASAARHWDVGHSPDDDGLRLTELVAALSLATDLVMGQPLEHALRTCRLAVTLANHLGLDAATAADVHYVALLRFLGCTADAPETAHLRRRWGQPRVHGRDVTGLHGLRERGRGDSLARPVEDPRCRGGPASWPRRWPTHAPRSLIARADDVRPLRPALAAPHWAGPTGCRLVDRFVGQCYRVW